MRPTGRLNSSTTIPRPFHDTSTIYTVPLGRQPWHIDEMSLEARPLPLPCSNSALDVLCCEASATAARLARQLRLPSHDLEDVRQDLLADLISRLGKYDPDRGSLGAFASTVTARRATRLAGRIRRERRVFAPVSLDDPLPGRWGGTLGDALVEGGGYAAWLGQPTDAEAGLERRLDLHRALETLGLADRALCAALAWSTPDGLSRAGHGARATLYRRLGEIRLRLMAAGLDGST